MRSEVWAALVDARPLSTAAEVERVVVENYSTYLHETIHWWQCIGSTYGLILSLTQVAKTHVTRPWIRRLCATIPPRKPIKALADPHTNSLNAEQQRQLNIILNKWHDLDFNARLTLRPVGDARAIDSVIEDRYFHSVGHTLHVGLAETLWTLGATVDPGFMFLPDSRTWDAAFIALETQKVDGYYRGSPVVLPAVGAQDIFEAQARLIQIQYLYLSNRQPISWNEFGSKGLLSSKYMSAFRFFLEVVGAQWPTTPISPEVNLFLLLCDLALNPADGYPFDLVHAESLAVTNDPGTRFALFCKQVAVQPSLLSETQTCSQEEYLYVSMVLCAAIGCRTPVEMCAEIVRWLSISDDLEQLLGEEENLSFANENLVVKLCFAKHLRFIEAKLDSPHFYCWPANYLVDCGHDFDFERARQLFMPHLPLFVASGDDEIKLAVEKHRLNQEHLQTFKDFYRWIIQYDLADQWISLEGPFNLNFTDIHPTLTPERVIEFAGPDFVDLWGVQLREVQ